MKIFATAWDFNKEYQRFVETNTFSPGLSAKHIGMLIDFHNQVIDNKRWKEYKNEIHDRNLYFYKLWKSAIEEMNIGKKPTIAQHSRPQINLSI